MNALKRFCKSIRRSTSGNAAILVGLGMPVLVGGTGYAVDTAQWYLYKRELQYAADQAALAGAWARANGDTGTSYQTRAGQEFDANISVTSGYTPVDAALLTDYDSGTQNSIVVKARMTADLPFSQIVLERPTAITVRSQATWENTNEFEACLLALDPTASGAITFNGGPVVNSNCGLGAISTANGAIEIKGNSGTYNVGTISTGGTVTDIHDGFAGSTISENQTGLFDPFESLTPPNNPTPRSLTCASSSSANYTADETTAESITYNYYRGRNRSQATATNSYADAKPNESSTSALVNQNYTSQPSDQTSTTNSGLYQVDGSGPDKIFEEAITTETISYTNVVVNTPSSGVMQPGTYSDFKLSCDTTLAAGIYVIDGGSIEVAAQYSLRGTGVMFVLKNGAGIKINGGSTIELSAMTANELMAVGVAADDAAKLEGMLIFEDPDSPGNANNKINGTATTALNGTIYLPNSDVTILGTAQQTSQCLMVAAKTIEIGGTADLLNFCPAGLTGDIVVGGGGARVRLVA